MIKTQLNSDKLAVVVSLICVVHCFAAPTILIFVSTFFPISYENELVHISLLMIAVPVSVLALALGYKNHQATSFFFIGLVGLSLLVFAVSLGENFLGGFGEKSLTLLGSTIVAYAHFKNHQICVKLNCACHENTS
jgi:hypothetical protein